MRIPPETIRSLVGLHAQRVSRTSAVGVNGKVAAPGRVMAADVVNLSDEAAMLNTLKQGVKAMPEVDAQRVQETRRELASGQFQIVPQQVAESVVLELGGAF